MKQIVSTIYVLYEKEQIMKQIGRYLFITFGFSWSLWGLQYLG